MTIQREIHRRRSQIAISPISPSAAALLHLNPTHFLLSCSYSLLIVNSTHTHNPQLCRANSVLWCNINAMLLGKLQMGKVQWGILCNMMTNFYRSSFSSELWKKKRKLAHLFVSQKCGCQFRGLYLSDNTLLHHNNLLFVWGQHRDSVSSLIHSSHSLPPFISYDLKSQMAFSVFFSLCICLSFSCPAFLSDPWPCLFKSCLKFRLSTSRLVKEKDSV